MQTRQLNVRPMRYIIRNTSPEDRTAIKRRNMLRFVGLILRKADNSGWPGRNLRLSVHSIGVARAMAKLEIAALCQ